MGLLLRETWETRCLDARVAKDADQAEISAIRHGSCTFDAGLDDDRIADAMDDFETSDPKIVQKWASEDMKFDSATSKIALEIGRRKSLLGGCYPFDVAGGNTIRYSPSKTLVYEFCLAISGAPSLSSGKFAKLPVEFEQLVCDALVCFLGPGAKVLRTGWPPSRCGGRSIHFKNIVAKLNKRTGEWQWNPEPGMPDNPTTVKDQGLDVVAWKEIADKRGGKLFLLCQCACGDNFNTKFYDLDAQFNKLGRWVRPISWVLPTRVFSTPRHIPNNSEFNQVNKDAGLALDRVRLTLLAEHKDHRKFFPRRRNNSYVKLIKLVIPSIKAA